jgi:hypothetical protein
MQYVICSRVPDFGFHSLILVFKVDASGTSGKRLSVGACYSVDDEKKDVNLITQGNQGSAQGLNWSLDGDGVLLALKWALRNTERI